MFKGIYITFCWSQSFGGGQNYINSKVKYLKEIGWNVIVFTPRQYKTNLIVWENLKEYEKGISLYLQCPPEFWPLYIRKKVIKWMSSFVNYQCGEIIIESPTDTTAEWGELLARELNAKHFCFLLDERLEEYRAKEFLFYKFQRGEIAGIDDSSIPKLFGVNIDGKCYKLSAANSGSVQDVENYQIEKIKRADFNIAYLGRDKAYVFNIVKSIYEFAEYYSDKSVHFIIMGEIDSSKNLTIPSNVIITKLGFLNPIPSSFFSKVDVVIAGAGCATISASQGVLTIVADARTFKSNGILGIDTESSLFSDVHSEDFFTTLENVLVLKKYNSSDIKMTVLPSYIERYQQHFEFIYKSNQDKTYFDFDKHKQTLDLKTRLNLLRWLLWYIKQ